MNAAGMVVGGMVMAAVFCIGMAAALMSLRDWLWFLGFCACVTVLIYGRRWLGRLVGIKEAGGTPGRRLTGGTPAPPFKPAGPDKPLILHIHDAGSIHPNGNVPHHQPRERV